MTTTSPMFGTDEILWYDNGKWGQAGYAIANPNGKVWTNNTVIYQFHELVGRNMFELMHRADVRFYAPPHKQFWFELHQLIVTRASGWPIGSGCRTIPTAWSCSTPARLRRSFWPGRFRFLASAYGSPTFASTRSSHC